MAENNTEKQRVQELLLDKDGNPQKEEVEITIPAFRAVSVFDVAQTDGKPIPELAAKELLADVEGYQDMIHAVEAISPVPIELEEIARDSKGYLFTFLSGLWNKWNLDGGADQSCGSEYCRLYSEGYFFQKRTSTSYSEYRLSSLVRQLNFASFFCAFLHLGPYIMHLGNTHIDI